ncbi:MAG: hypothetical protein LKF36_00785 [Lactobacillus sp.]|nr:hypothetical protein [Lactobacillus sp.]
MTLSEARKKANKKWDTENKARKNYINKRSIARNFVLKDGSAEDVDEILQLIMARKNKTKS